MWLGGRASEVGADRALGDLNRYLDADYFPALQVMALGGVIVDRSHELSDSISLVPFGRLPASRQKRWLQPQRGLPIDKSAPTAALIREFQHPKMHLEPDSETPDELRSWNEAQDLRDARLCLSLAGPCGPVRVAKWEQAAAWVPCLGGEHSPTSIQRPLSAHVTRREELSTQEIKRAAAFLDKYSKVERGKRDWLQTALERFSSAYQRPSDVDKAIDLGIAIETTFLHDIDQFGELTFRIRTRAARLLGSTAAERKDLYRLFGDLYSLRSSAVHEGRLPSSKMRGRTPREVLEQGFEQLAKAIHKIIDEDVFDWQAVTLE